MPQNKVYRLHDSYIINENHSDAFWELSDHDWFKKQLERFYQQQSVKQQ